MLKITLSYVAAAAVLLTGVSAYGASSTFPSSVSEVPPAWYYGDTHTARNEAHVGATGRVLANASQEPSGAAGRRFGRSQWESSSASAFPSSPNESGPSR